MYFSRVALVSMYLLSICFTSRRKASHLAMTHHPLFGGNFWKFLHGIIYFLLTHFPIITIFPDLMSLGKLYIPAKMDKYEHNTEYL